MTHPADLPATARPPLTARLAFAASRAPNLTMMVPTFACFALCLIGPAVIAVVTGEREAARVMLVVAGFATFAWFVIAMLFVARLGGRPAGPTHIAAALQAATHAERPHLLRQIEARVGDRYRTDPLTIDELARLFREVRDAHGTRTKRREERRDRAKRAQQDYVARLMAPETGREGPQQPR